MYDAWGFVPVQTVVDGDVEDEVVLDGLTVGETAGVVVETTVVVLALIKELVVLFGGHIRELEDDNVHGGGQQNPHSG